MTYAAIVEHMEKKERDRFNRSLLADDPRRRVAASVDVGSLMAAFGMPGAQS